MAKTRVLGIDLGTSNSALALAESVFAGAEAGDAAGGATGNGAGAPGDAAAHARALPVTQVLGPGRLGEKRTFASALFFPVTGQFPPDSLRPPWSDREPPWVAGDFAREAGAQSPDRLVASAKSWLSYRSVDPTRPILPWNGTSGGGKVSPLEASRIYLEHLKSSWLSRDPGGLDGARVVLTVPASFDEVARKLTLQAARDAGLGEDVILLEEPQAAFYAWLDAVGPDWRGQIAPGDTVLVCDVGGGTCDFSLIAVSERDGDLDLERIAVGRHILLGGDNMDLALAFALRQRMEGEGRVLDDWQFQALIQACRNGKETLFERPELAEAPVSLPSRGSGLLSGTVSVTLPRSLLEAVIVDGFFALTGPADLPAAAAGGGLRELGLPYEADACLSRHLAAFLVRSRAIVAATASSAARATSAPNASSAANGSSAADASKAAGDSQASAPSGVAPSGGNPPAGRGGPGMLRPDAVLFNGGVFRPSRLRERVLELLHSWDPSRPVRELAGADPDLAVARGAAAYGLAKLTGRGVRIRAGASRSYYIGLDPTMPAIPGWRPPVKALCVVPLGMEEGSEQVLEDREFGLTTGSTVTFRFFSSPARAADRVGSVVADAEKDLEETSRLEMTLPAVEGLGDSAMVPVQLHARLSELGTLELWMQRRDAQDRWQLDFDVRTA